MFLFIKYRWILNTGNYQEYTARNKNWEGKKKRESWLIFWTGCWILQVHHSCKTNGSSILLSREVEGKFRGEDMSLKLEAGAGLNS